MTFDFTELMHDLDIELPEDTTRVAAEITHKYDEWQNESDLDIDLYAVLEDGDTELVYSDSFGKRGLWNVYDLLEEARYEELLEFIDETEGFEIPDMGMTLYTDEALRHN